MKANKKMNKKESDVIEAIVAYKNKKGKWIIINEKMDKYIKTIIKHHHLKRG